MNRPSEPPPGLPGGLPWVNQALARYDLFQRVKAEHAGIIRSFASPAMNRAALEPSEIAELYVGSRP